MQFEWDPRKNAENEAKHGVSFFEAQMAFADPNGVVRLDRKHSTKKKPAISALARSMTKY
jgi:uncharacterized DUF497 family protein